MYDFTLTTSTPLTTHPPTHRLLHNGPELYADSAYVGRGDIHVSYNFIGHICEKGCRDHPMTDEQKESDWVKSKIRSRVEHVFGFMEGAMHGLTARSVGFARACKNIFLTWLAYNPLRVKRIVPLGIN
ncbi:MAG: transposase [Bacteroidales bacterium]|nr:transposase [Bacteroidales bacterium]